MDETAYVHCYSGSRYAERPLSFDLGGERFVVEVVEKTWRSPSALHFYVRTQGDERFELAYRADSGKWDIRRLCGEIREL